MQSQRHRVYLAGLAMLLVTWVALSAAPASAYSTCNLTMLGSSVAGRCGTDLVYLAGGSGSAWYGRVGASSTIINTGRRAVAPEPSLIGNNPFPRFAKAAGLAPDRPAAYSRSVLDWPEHPEALVRSARPWGRRANRRAPGP